MSEGSSKRERIVVFDTTLRDGEQAAGVCFSLEAKLEIARALDAMRIDVIEAGFPASSRAEREGVRAIAKAVRGATVCALTRALRADLDVSWEAIREARDPRLHVFLSSSELHLDHQLRKGGDAVIEMASAAVAYARTRTANVEFSPMDATRSDPTFLARLVRAVLAAGATTLNLPDTVGCARPAQVAALIRELHARVPELHGAVVSFHGHDDLGLATANTLAAIEAGARQVELTANGIGERAGNTPLEEVLMALRVHGPALGVEARVDTRGLYRLARLVEAHSGLLLPANKAVVGHNAFRHASGIHQDGVLKLRETYEALDPAELGHPTGSEIVLGKLSGRSGFAARVERLGFVFEGRALDRAFARFQRIADSAREVDDATLRAVCEAGAPS